MSRSGTILADGSTRHRRPSGRRTPVRLRRGRSDRRRARRRARPSPPRGRCTGGPCGGLRRSRPRRASGSAERRRRRGPRGRRSTAGRSPTRAPPRAPGPGDGPGAAELLVGRDPAAGAHPVPVRQCSLGALGGSFDLARAPALDGTRGVGRGVVRAVLAPLDRGGTLPGRGVVAAGLGDASGVGGGCGSEDVVAVHASTVAARTDTCTPGHIRSCPLLPDPGPAVASGPEGES